jgi:pilus assembly protein Flp/PilA
MRRLTIRQYLKNISGATAIEYGLIAAGIALTILASVYLFGETLYTLFYTDLANILSAS